ncbi:MAG: MmgE/PrpD family protein [Desulforhopalus sp.]
MNTNELPDRGYAEYLAGFVSGLDLDSVPRDVVGHAKLLFLDLLGAALAGTDTVEAEAALRAVGMMMPGGGPCTLWGTSKTSSPNGAALFNGIVAHSRELDDFGGADHSGAVVVPALIAVAEAYPVVSGKRFLEAMIAGYEVARRVLESAGGYRPHNHQDGYHSTGTCGSFGAAAAVAKALDLSMVQTVSAIGLAGSFTGGTWAFTEDGAMSKRYHVGRAAETGVTAGCLAGSGFTGPAYVFEAPWGGFLSTYARHDPHPEALVKDLGTTYRIMRSGIKPYAACRDIHSVLDVVLDVRRNHRLTPGDIHTIKVRCIPEMMQMVGKSAFPLTRIEAQLSLSYSIAVALLTGRAFTAEYEAPYLTDPEVVRLFDLVELVESPELPFDSEPHVTFFTKAGRSIEGHVEFARGAPQNPMKVDEVVEKFMALASKFFPDPLLSELPDILLSLESLDDLRIVTQYLRLPPDH